MFVWLLIYFVNYNLTALNLCDCELICCNSLLQTAGLVGFYFHVYLLSWVLFWFRLVYYYFVLSLGFYLLGFYFSEFCFLGFHFSKFWITDKFDKLDCRCIIVLARVVHCIPLLVIFNSIWLRLIYLSWILLVL